MSVTTFSSSLPALHDVYKVNCDKVVINHQSFLKLITNDA